MKFRVLFLLTLMLLNPLLAGAAAVSAIADPALGGDHCEQVTSAQDAAATDSEHRHSGTHDESDCAQDCGSCSACSAVTVACLQVSWHDHIAMRSSLAKHAPPAGITAPLYRPPILS